MNTQRRPILTNQSPYSTHEEAVRHATSVEAQRPEPVHCCEEMGRAVDAGLIDGGEMVYTKMRYGEELGYSFTIKLCPFCGTAVKAEGQ